MGEALKTLILSPPTLYERTVRALRDLSDFARRVVGIEEVGVGVVEEPREYVRWLADHTGDEVAEGALLTLIGKSGALIVRVRSDTYHVLVGPVYRTADALRAALAHELAHLLQRDMGLFPENVLRPPGAVRSVLLPLEVGAEEVVLGELPEIGEVRIEMAEQEARRWYRTGDPVLDLENALVVVPIKLAAQRLGIKVRIREPEVTDREVERVKSRLVRLAESSDPWDRKDVVRYARRAVSVILDWLEDQDLHHSTRDSNSRRPSSDPSS